VGAVLNLGYLVAVTSSKRVAGCGAIVYAMRLPGTNLSQRRPTPLICAVKVLLSGGRKRRRRRSTVYWCWLVAISIGAILLVSAVVTRI
jgi:hypothetical protein